MEESLRNWLKSYGLQEYAERLEDDGWEKLDDIFHIDEHELNACIHKAGHRKRFHHAVEEAKATGVHPSITNQETNKEAFSPSDDNSCSNTNTTDVEIWLQTIGLGQYVTNLQEAGWDWLEVIKEMGEQDIRNCIDKAGHRKRFQISMKRYDPASFHQISSEVNATVIPDSVQEKEKDDVKIWLTENGLELYFNKLVEKGWDNLEVLFELGANEEDLKECICKPGHRRRFQRAVTNKRATENCDPMRSVKVYEETENMPVTRRTEMEDNAYMQHASNESNSDFATVRDDFESSTLDSLQSSYGSDKDNHIADDGITTEDDLVQRHTLSQNNTGSLKDINDDKPLESVESTCARNVNQADSTGSYSVETEKLDHRDVGTSSQDTNRSQQSDPLPHIPSTVYIHKSKNISMGVGAKIVDVSKTLLSPDAKRNRINFKKHMKTALEVAKEKDDFYVETNAYLELEKKVANDHWGVITGIPGDGKTSMASHLALKYNNVGYEYMELHFAQEWKDWVHHGKKQFVLIDDIFGRMSIDERKVSYWSSIIDFMQKVVQQRQGCLKVVCTSRKYIFEDVKTKLAQYACFQKPAVIDMTQAGLTLSPEEKLQIWHAYERKFGITMPNDFIHEETKLSHAPHGFPHCVDLYFSSPSLQKAGFFENPMQCIRRELLNFKDHDKVKYCALLLVLLNGNKLKDVYIEKMAASDPGFKPIFSAAGLSTHQTSNDLKQALKGLRGTYITQINGCYSISHDSIRENLALIFIKQNPVYAINNMEFEYLIEHTRCPGQTSSEDPDSRLMKTLKSQYNDDLVTRMLQEIERGNVVTVCLHQAWDDKAFVEYFIQYLLKKSKESDDDQHGYTSIDYVFNTKDSPTSFIFDYSLFDALGAFGHKKAVEQMTQSQLKPIIDHIPGPIETPKELSYEKSLSLCLHRIMNHIGASQVLREFQINSAISMEVLDTVCTYIAKEKFRCYIFGSHSEGTRIITHIQKRDCDVNYLTCLEDIEVVQSLSEIKSEKNTQYLLAVTDDKITKPGYVKLQIVNNGIPQTKGIGGGKAPDTMFDHQDRLVLYKRRPDKIHVDEIKGSNVTTDVVTRTVRKSIGDQEPDKILTGTDYEMYHSLRCRSWPIIATKWISRNRHHTCNWPPRSVIEQIKSLGVFLVPVGSQDSIEKDMEWKILFLLQERKLMSILNDTQYKCYIILKMINNDIISYHFKEPILVPYHLKSCLFYVIENTQGTLWKPERLLDCVQICLKHILQCVNHGNCPNYFIEQENMFSRRVGGEVQTKLKNVLLNVVANGVSFWYFPYITCGNLGPRLVQAIRSERDTVETDKDLVPSQVRLYLKLIKFLSLVKMRILCKCYSTDVEECIRLHFQEAVRPLHKAEEIMDHSKEETKRAFQLVIPYVELSLMSVLVARQLEMPDDNELSLQLLKSKKWREIGLLIPARLKQATFLHMCGQISASLSVLSALDQIMNPSVISVCGCQYYHTEVDIATIERIKDMPEPEFRRNMCVSCIAFLPTEERIIPGVLGYEMRRAKVTTAADPTAISHFWYNWAVVDGKVLLYLILYLNYRTIICRDNSSSSFASVPSDIRTKKDNVIRELQDTIKYDPNLGHKETGLNILGWIYRQEGDEDKAERCFRESLEIQSTYNAANLHMEELVYYGR